MTGEVSSGPDSTPDGVHTDRVEVDPKLFGEFPDGEIEIVEEHDDPFVTDEQAHQWVREATMVQLTGACPYCDGPVEERVVQNHNSKDATNVKCTDCNERWIVAE